MAPAGGDRPTRKQGRRKRATRAQGRHNNVFGPGVESSGSLPSGGGQHDRARRQSKHGPYLGGGTNGPRRFKPSHAAVATAFLFSQKAWTTVSSTKGQGKYASVFRRRPEGYVGTKPKVVASTRGPQECPRLVRTRGTPPRLERNRVPPSGHADNHGHPGARDTRLMPNALERQKGR